MEQQNQFDLLKKRRFLPFFFTQFFGAFNDNVFKNSLIILIAFEASTQTEISTNTLINICAGLFILPFFLFSATAGQLADKYDKSKMIKFVKIAEIIIMSLAALAFVYHKIFLLIGLLFLMGVQSSFFGPLKYSILPQHLKDTELVGGNGIVGMGTFLAILLGTLAGGIFISIKDTGPIVVAATIICLAILGWVASCFIPAAPANDKNLKINWEPISQTWRTIQFAKENRTVFLSILGNSWFWFFGAVILTQIPIYSKTYLGGTEHVVTLLLTMFSIGVGLGSLFCERLSGHKVELGLVPFGSIGLSIFGIDIFFAHPEAHTGALMDVPTFLHSWQNIHVLLDATLLGLFGGFYIVPLNALIQQRSNKAHRSRIIAANNIFNALFMVIAAVYGAVVLAQGMTIPQLFLSLAIINIFIALYIYTLVPEFLMRFMIWILISLLYRIKLKNIRETIPDEGPAVIICNHLSFVDALIISGAVRRPIRFVMDHRIFKTPILSFIFRTGKAIPIAPQKEDPNIKEQAFKAIAKALEQGDLVGIFPEGGITYDGEIQPFKPGIEQIIQTTPVPVIPLAIRGLWGSFFSRHGGKAMRSWPRKLWAKIELVAAEPVPPEQVTKEYLHKIVCELRGEKK